MRVLVVSRPDRHVVAGGDIVQIEHTIGRLRQYGVEVDTVDSIEGVATTDYDLVHFFHLPAVSITAVRRVVQANVPIVLSPIFWDVTPLWFGSAAARPGVWQCLATVLGVSVARKLYVARQHAKRGRSTTWIDAKKILGACDMVLPNSHAELVHLARHFRVPLGDLQPKSLVVPNGVDPVLFRNPGQAYRQFAAKYGVSNFILEVGRIEPAKGQAQLIEATRHLPSTLVFVGRDSPYAADYARWCRELALRRGNTMFLGPMLQVELVGAYAAAAVHVLPSWRETPGLVSLEAAAAGCKVVSTLVGSAREYFGDLAWYCHPGDRRSVRRSVEQALQASIGGELQNRIMTLFTWDRAAEMTYTAYRRVVGV